MMKNLMLDQDMLLYMAMKAIQFEEVVNSKFRTAIVEMENNKARLPELEVTCVSLYEKLYVKRQILDKFKALLDVVISKLEQLIAQKHNEVNGIINYQPQVELLTVNKKENGELQAQHETEISNLDQRMNECTKSMDEIKKYKAILGVEDGFKREGLHARIKEWQLKVVNKNATIGLKKIGGDNEELWNIKENRVATLDEAISYLFVNLQVGLDTDLRPLLPRYEDTFSSP